MKKVILVTGGQRSGKSSFAEKKAHELTTSPVYLATAKIWDDEISCLMPVRKGRANRKQYMPEWLKRDYHVDYW